MKFLLSYTKFLSFKPGFSNLVISRIIYVGKNAKIQPNVSKIMPAWQINSLTWGVKPELTRFDCVRTDQHSVISVVSHREEMRRHLCLPLSFVVLNDVICVDGQPLVRVDGHTEESRICLNGCNNLLIFYNSAEYV